MKKSILIIAVTFFGMFSFQSCNMGGGSGEMENTDLVSSGTYVGTTDEVDPDEKEIYVETKGGKILELYFTNNTKLMRNGESVSFSELAKGQKVEVDVEKKGKRLEPLAVRIMP